MRYLILILCFLPFIGFSQIQLVGNITTFGGGSYPTHIDSLGYGGHRVVADATERDAITQLRRKVGMVVFQVSDSTLYRLRAPITSNDWVPVLGDLEERVDTSLMIANQLSRRSSGGVGLGNSTGVFTGGDAPTSNVTIPLSSTYYTRFGNTAFNNLMYLWGGTNPGIGFNTTTTSANYPFQFGSGASFQGNLQILSNIRDSRENSLITQSSSATVTNRDLAIGNGSYGRMMFQSSGFYFYRSGVFPAVATWSFAVHGGTSTGINQSGTSILIRPESPAWGGTTANGGDIYLRLPNGVGTGKRGTFYIQGTTTGDSTQTNLLSFSEDSLLKIHQYGTATFESTYRGFLAMTATGRVVPVDKNTILGTSINSQTGTTYTSVLGDVGVMVTMSNVSANTFTIPPNSSVAFPVGTKITIVQTGSGQTTIAPGSGVTINSADSANKTRVIYSSAQIIKTATDTWLLIGDIIP